MRIGVLTTSYPRWSGDPAGPFVAALNRWLVAAGHQVDVLAAGSAADRLGPHLAASKTPPILDDSGSVVRRVPSSLFYAGGAPDALLSGPTALLEAARFSAVLAARFHDLHRRYDAFVSHWLLPCGVLAAALSDGRPHVAVAHSSDVHLLRRLRGQAVVRWISRRARLVYSAASLRVPGAAGHVVPMGIDCAHFAASPDERRALRAALGVDRPTVLFLGRLVAVKGISVLLQALSALPDAVLWIAGDGPLRPALMEQASVLGPRVQFLGTIVGDERRRRLLACDVLALPSLRLPDGRTEGAPQVVLEALAAGAKVVASDVGGVADLLGDAGWCLPPGDVAAWQAGLAQALQTRDDAHPRRAMAQAARFDWSLTAPRIVGEPFGCG